MFPQFSDIINYLFGTNINIPIQSYGLMVALAYLTGAFILQIELKRKEKEGLLMPQTHKELKGTPPKITELIGLALAGLLIGYKFVGIIVDYGEFSENPQEYIFSAKGNWIGAIVLSIVMVAYRYYKKKKEQLKEPVEVEVVVHPYQLTSNILILAAISGLLGAKIFHHLENFQDFLNDPAGEFFSFMGLTFYGGLIVGIPVVLWYIRKNKMPALIVLDAAAPAIMLAYGIGRIGCMLSGDGCWGIENLNPKPAWLSWLPDWMWGFRFPHNVINEGIIIDNCSGKHCHILENPVYPTSFYDTVLCVIFFIILWSIRKKINIHGILFTIMIFIMGVQRLLLEQIRVNNKFNLVGLQITQAELISSLLIIFSIIAFWFLYKKHKKNQKKIV